MENIEENMKQTKNDSEVIDLRIIFRKIWANKKIYAIGSLASSFGIDLGSMDYMLSKKQNDVASAIRKGISISIDKQTAVITISTETQDPLACKTLADANTDVVLTSMRAKQEDLENEMQLKYNAYTAMTTQYQAAKAKVQERTPAFTVVKGTAVPIKTTGPKRKMRVAETMSLGQA